MPSKISNLIALVRRRYTSTPLRCALRAYVARPKPSDRRNAPLVVVEGVEDGFFYTLFGVVVAGLRKHQNIDVEAIIPRGTRVGASSSLKVFIAGRLEYNVLTDWRLAQWYGAYCSHIAYRATCLISPFKALRLWYEAWRIWRGLASKDALAALRIRGVVIGDLIIDSYLRYKPSPRVELTDTYLLVVLRQALKNIDLAFAYFSKRKPALYLTTYTTYIEHGIPARVAAQLGIPVASFANAQRFAKFLTPDDPFQSNNPSAYRQVFSALADREAKIAAGDASLAARIAGKIDATIITAKVSPYLVQTQDVPDVRRAYVIFLHDFYDSVHIYRWITFHDFWEWLLFTVDTLNAAGIPFLLKPHPNQSADSDRELQTLRSLYPDIRFVSSKVTNKQLVDGGMACAVTVYGTVASEMAYMGVPTVASGENPHVDFPFCRTARSKEEYKAFLLAARDHVWDREEMKREACAFFYMHNMHLIQERDIIDRLGKALIYLWFSGATPSPERFIDLMRDLENEPGFEAFVAKLSAVVKA